MKFIKSVFLLSSILFLSISFSFASGSKSVCPGENVNLIWSSTGCTAWNNEGSDQTKCPYTGANGNTPINSVDSACSVTFSCTGAGGASLPDSADLTLTPNASCGTISGTSCAIAENASTCDAMLTWNSTGLSNPQIVNDTISSMPIISGTPNTSVTTGMGVRLTNGTQTFRLNNNGKNIGATTIGGACATGTVWSGGVCLAGAVNVTLTAPNCTIAWGGAGCTSATSWSHVSGLEVSTIRYSYDGLSPSTINTPSGNANVTFGGVQTKNAWLGGNSVSTGAWVVPVTKSFSSACTTGTTWQSDGCWCPALGQYWNGSSCATCSADHYCPAKSSS